MIVPLLGQRYGGYRYRAGERAAGLYLGPGVEFDQRVCVQALYREGVLLAPGQHGNELAAVEVLGLNALYPKLVAQRYGLRALEQQILVALAQRYRQKVHHAVGQLHVVERETALAPGDAYGLDAVADVGAPVLGYCGHAAHYAQERAQRGAGAVGVVAAVDGVYQGLLEVALAVQQTQHHEAHVGGRLEPAQVGAVLYQQLAAVAPAHAALVGVHHYAHAARHAAVLGYLAQADVQERLGVVDDEGGALHGGHEYGGVGALAVAVVHAGVLKRHAYGLFRQAGVQAGPYLGAYPRAVGVLPLLVVHLARHGREYAVAHVGLAYAVLVPVGGYIGYPVFAQHLAVYGVGAQVVHGAQPYQLQVEVVVGQGLAGLGGKAAYVVYLLTALIGSAQRAADVLAYPAGVYAIP